MDIDKICLTCLSSTGPFLSIYDNGSGSCLADMLREFTKTTPRRHDNLPEKVCLGCLSEINHCYTFKIMCENSSRTLRQLLPNALPEESEPDKVLTKQSMSTSDQAVQTSKWEPSRCTVTEQAEEVVIDDSSLSKRRISFHLDDGDGDGDGDGDAEGEGEGEEFDYELTDEPMEKATGIILQVQQSLKVEKEVDFTQAAVIYEGDDNDLEQQIRECNLDIFENEVADVSVPAQPVATKKGVAKLLVQQQQEGEEEIVKQEAHPAKKSSRRRAAEKQELHTTSALSTSPSKQLRSGSSHRSLTSVAASAAATSSSAAGGTSLAAGGAALVAELKYHCDRCNAGFALEKSLIIHKRQNSCTNRNFKCDECERVFVSPDHLAEHRANHGAHNCAECGLKCESKEQLGKHMVQGHKRNLRNQCSVCQKVFTMLSTLRDHMRIHTGEKPFVCNICGKSFTQNANLRQHKLRHSETKSFKCELCPHSFVTKAELASHARTHTGDKPFECEVCAARFTTSCSLAKHKRKHTGERPYACDLCPMRFTALNVLKNHRRTHTGERPYVCPFCAKTFTQRGDCQMHQRTHQGDRIYICPVCNEEFKTMPEMRSHLSGHEQHDKRLVHFTLISNKENGSGALEDDLNEMAESALMI